MKNIVAGSAIALAFLILSCDKAIDFSRPDVRIVEPEDGATFDYATTVTIKVEATDNRTVDRVELYVDGERKTLNAVPYEYRWTANALGWHTLKAKAYDAGDNWRETEKEVRFQIKVGEARLIAPGDGTTFGVWDKVALDWDDVPGATAYRVQIANNPNFSAPRISNEVTTSSMEVAAGQLPNGTYYWQVQAKAPEWGQGSEVRSFTVEGQPAGMVYIPAGSFQTGDNFNEADRHG